MAKTNNKIEMTKEEEAKKELVENLIFNSVVTEFKNAKFEKYCVSKYMLTKEEIAQYKGEAKAIKNIDFVTNIEYSADGNEKSVAKITNYHYNIFKDNAIKFIKKDSGFDLILKSLTTEKQLALFKTILLDYSKQKNVSVRSKGVFVSGAKTLVRRFVIDVVTAYCEL